MEHRQLQSYLDPPSRAVAFSTLGKRVFQILLLDLPEGNQLEGGKEKDVNTHTSAMAIGAYITVR